MAMVANLDDTSVSSPAGFGFEALPTQIQGWANICAGTDFQGHCGFSVKPVQSPRCTVLKIRKYKKYDSIATNKMHPIYQMDPNG